MAKNTKRMERSTRKLIKKQMKEPQTSKKQLERIISVFKACGKYLIEHPKVLIASVSITALLVIGVSLFAIFAPAAFAATLITVGGVIGISSGAGTLTVLGVLTCVANLAVSGLVIVANNLAKATGQEKDISTQDILSALGAETETETVQFASMEETDPPAEPQDTSSSISASSDEEMDLCDEFPLRPPSGGFSDEETVSGGFTAVR